MPFLKSLFNMEDGGGDLPGLRLALASGLGLAIGGLAGLLVLIAEPKALIPVELMGCQAYLEDLNISNRLLAATVFLLVSWAVFLAAVSGSWSRRLAEKFARGRLYEQGGRLYDDLRILTGRLLEAFLDFGGPSEDLKALRRQEGQWLFAGLIFTTALPAMSALLVNLVMSYLWPGMPLSFWPVLKRIFVVLQIAWAGGLVYAWLKSPGAVLPRLVLRLQYAVLPFFLLLLPTPVSDGQALVRLLPSGRLIWIALGLIILGIFDIRRRRGREWGRGLFSPLALLALLWGYAQNYGPLPEIWTNTFELGARLPEFYMVASGQLKLFADIYITYGLHDMAGFALGWLAFGQPTVAAAGAGMTLWHILLLSVFFLLALRLLPPTGAFILAFLIGGNAQIMVGLYAAVLLLPALVRRPLFWLMAWVALSALFPFARIPQGTIAVLASLPGAAFQAWQLRRSGRGPVLALAVFSLIAAGLVLVWPFGDNFRGLMRIFLETAEVNGPWGANLSPGFTVHPQKILAFFSFFLLPLLAMVAARYMRGRDIREQDLAVAAGRFVAPFVLIYTACSLSYAFSRMDYSYNVRNYQVAISMAGVLALAIGRFCPRGRAGNLLLLILLLTAVSRPLEWFYPRHIFRGGAGPFQTAEIADGKDYGLPNLGRGIFNGAFLAEEAAVRRALDRVLEPDETLLDLTIEGLHYFTSERRLLTEYPVYYVYPGDKPQKRALEVIGRRGIKVSLLDGSMVIDGSPVNLRGYYLYRQAVLSGRPWEISPTKTLLMPEDYFKRIGLEPPSLRESLPLLDKQFPNLDFKLIPSVWGRGFSKWRNMSEIINWDDQLEETVKTEHRFEAPQGLRGREGGLLLLNIDKAPSEPFPVEIIWSDRDWPGETNKIRFTARRGLNLVPLDAAPRWLLADDISQLTAISQLPFSINTCRLLNR